MYVMTAYFVDPQTICSGSGVKSQKYIGDRLLIQTGKTPDVHMSIPIDESGLATTKWVKGGCFVAMGKYSRLQNLLIPTGIETSILVKAVLGQSRLSWNCNVK